ncbi:MAG: hemerythrin domain-containing protein [Candidatus Doudnabacteria bacterium]|nr:hemerythrin domain-containing protein [Candidatus Doudnabacteria bacterium]
MPTPTKLLNEDGSASMATMLLLSHHAFRRDMARFLTAIEHMIAGDHSRDEAVQAEWKTSFCTALHGHHAAEDTHIFPDIRKNHPELSAALDTLTEQHHHIDPVLEQGNAAFADLAHPEKAQAVMQELKILLDEHLAFEEAEITPTLRSGKDFPQPADEAAAAMYAQGFAWSMHGIAPSVVEHVTKLLPDILTSKLPAARDEFEKKCARVWGTYAVGEATTSVPDEYIS